MYVLQNKENVDMDLGFVDLKSSQPGPRKVSAKTIDKRRDPQQGRPPVSP
jgi:hypothetical protein